MSFSQAQKKQDSHHLPPCDLPEGRLKTVLRSLGVNSFRGIQEDVVRSIHAGRDTLALAATGAGKTLCYQASSLLRPSWTLVCSPLLALMEDQLNSCNARGLHAHALKGDMDREEREAVLQTVLKTDAILFASPEIINARRSLLRDMIEKQPPGLAVFDEAHCISAWGQNFRPDYASVGNTLNQAGRLRQGQGPAFPILAMTATATQEIMEDIRSSLSLQQAEIIRGQTYRDSISFEVRAITPTAEEDIQSMFPHILNDLQWFAGKNGIIYCRKKKDVDWLHDALKSTHAVSRHHSSLPATERQINSQRFLDGHSSIMIATIGFGMGLDRGDIDFVIHAGPAASPEDWTQEAGRGGRDGRHSWSITYLCPGFSKNIRAAFTNRAKGYGLSRQYVRQLLGQAGCHNHFLRTWNSGPEEGKTPSPCCNQCSHEPSRTPPQATSEAIQLYLSTLSNKPSQRPSVGFLEDVLFAAGFIDHEEETLGGFSRFKTHLASQGKTFLQDASSLPCPFLPHAQTLPDGRAQLFADRMWRENIDRNAFLKATASAFTKKAQELLPDFLFKNYYDHDKTGSLGQNETIMKNIETDHLSLDFSM